MSGVRISSSSTIEEDVAQLVERETYIYDLRLSLAYFIKRW